MPHVNGELQPSQVKSLAVYDVASYGTDLFLPLTDVGLTETALTFSGVTMTRDTSDSNQPLDSFPRVYSDTDTEVVLNAYIEWKEKCFEKFNGEWALSILDKKENTLIICRDGIGYKPCYIYEDEMYFAFSSEIKSFYCLHSSLNFNLSNIGIIPETLSYSSKTVFTNVSQLTQGRLIKINLQDNKKKLNGTILYIIFLKYIRVIKKIQRTIIFND